MPATLTGTVFRDLDHDGLMAPGHPGIQGINVVLCTRSVTGSGASACTTAVTDADGRYSFTVNQPGTMTLYETAVTPTACPPDFMGQPAGYSHSNGSRKRTITITEDQIAGNQTLQAPDFSHDTLFSPIDCNSDMLLFQGQPTVMYPVSLITGIASAAVPLSREAWINAVGYDVLDSLVYGYDQLSQNIARVDQSGEVTLLAPRPEGMPAAAYSVGTLDTSGFYYIYLPGSSRYYTIDLRPNSPSYLKLVDPSNGYTEQTANYGTPLTMPLTIGDWAYSLPDGHLYGVGRNGIVYRIDPINGSVTPLETAGPNPGDTFGSVVMDGNGILYAANNSDGIIYRYLINADSASGTAFSSTQLVSFNDGALCPYAVIELDFGDAPDAGSGSGAGNYHTFLASNGPRHGLGSPLYLGTQVTAELDAYANAAANGDDLTQGIQDDGLTVPLPLLTVSASSYSLTVTVTNYTENTAYLYGWIDFNQNGLFEAPEAAPVASIPAYSGTVQYTLDFTVPPGTTLRPDHTFVRLRFTSELLTDTGLEIQDTRSVGPAPDGEVEDYILKVGTVTDLSILKTADPDVLVTGDMIRFTITITNNGPEDALDVFLEDNVPPEISNVMYSVDGSPFDYWAGSLSLGTLAPGRQAVVVIEGIFDGSTLGPVVNTATVTSHSEDSDPGNNSSTTITPVNRAANLVITKIPDRESAVIGEELIFEISVINNGPDPADNVIITDFAESDFSGPEYSLDGGNTWNPWYGQLDVGTLEVNNIVSFLLRGRVESGFSDILTNTASVTSDTGDPDPNDNSVTVTVPKNASADLSIIKTGFPNPVGLGQTITYTVTVFNSGPSQAENVVITDKFPTQLQNPEYSEDQFNWFPWTGEYFAGPLPPGSSYTLYLRAVVDPYSAAGELLNTVTVNSDTPDPDPNNNIYTEVIISENNADLSITKTASPDTAIAGDLLTYTITITNNGPSDAVDVILSDPLPGGLTEAEFTSDGINYQPWPGDYFLPVLVSGTDAVITIRARVAETQTESLVNTAVVTSATPDPDTGNNTSTVTTLVKSSADLVLVKTGPDSVTAGEMITYILTLTNEGPSIASDVVITDAVPAAIDAPEYSWNGIPQGMWPGSIVFDYIVPGTSVIITIQGTINPSASGSLINSASVNAATPDPDPDNNSSQTTAEIAASADLSVVKTSAPDPAAAGQSLTYTLIISNAGPSAAQDVIVEDDLPDVFTAPEYSSDGLTWRPWTSPYSIGTLEPGSVSLIYIRGTVSPAAAGSISNTASVSSATPDPDSGNNTFTVTTPVTASSDLSVTKTAVPATVLPGGLLTYTVTIAGSGPADSRNVALDDTVSPLLNGVQYSLDNGITWAEWTGTAGLGTITAGGSAIVLIRGTVNSTASGTISNTAVVRTDTPDPDPENNSAEVLTPVETSADLSVMKTASPDPAAAGQVLTYTITVHNDGPDTARDVLLTDTVPNELAIPEFSADGGRTWFPWAGSYSIGSLDSGTDLVILIRGTVYQASSGLLRNDVSVSSSTPDPDPDNNTYSLLTPVESSADISVVKTAAPTPAVPGSVITYTILISNAGPDTAENVMLTDNLPQEIWSAEYSLNGSAFTPWNGNLGIGSLAAGTSAAVTIRGTVSPETLGTLFNSASVNTTTPDPDPQNNDTTVVTPLEPSANLAVTKTGAPSPAVPGQLVTYTVTVSNAGPSNAADITVTDAVPSVINTAEYQIQGTSAWLPWPGTYRIAVLEAGNSETISIRGILSPSATGRLVNTAVITSSTPDPDPDDNRFEVDLPIEASADISILKTAAPSPAVPGQLLTYTLTAANAGPSDARNVTITDRLPDVLINQEYSNNGGLSWRPWNGSYPITSLAGGTSVTILVRGVLPLSAAGAVSLTNVSTVTSETNDPNPDNNTSTSVTPVSPLADLAISKTAAPSYVSPGGILTYRITAVNHGPGEASEVRITDTVILNELIQVQYSTDGGNTWSPWSGTYEAGTLPSGGESSELLIRGTVPSGTVLVSNAASVSSATPDPEPDNNSVTVIVNVGESADLSITKEARPSPAIPGKQVTYTITLTNNGPDNARNVTLTDAVPSSLTGLEFSADRGMTWNAWSSPYAVGTLNSGGSAVILIRGTLSASASGSFTNSASVSSSTHDPYPENNTVSVVTPVDPAADISIIKLPHPNPARPGQYLTYTILVFNAGPADALDVMLTDIIQNGEYSLDNGIHWSPWTGSYRFGRIAAGTPGTILIRTLIPADASGSIENTASATSSTPDPEPDNNTVTVITPISETADLSIVKTADSTTVKPGDVVIYRISITNHGPIDAQNVMLRDRVPEALANVQFSSDEGASWSVWASPYPLGAVRNQETRTVLLRGTVASTSGSILNTAYITSDTPDPDYSNNTSHVSVTVDESASADLSLVKTACCDSVCPCHRVEYHLTVKNLGPAAAENVLLTDLLPSDITDAHYSFDSGCTWGRWTGQLSLEDLAAGSSVSLILSGMVSCCACGAITNEASVTSSTPDPYPDNNRSSATVCTCRN